MKSDEPRGEVDPRAEAMARARARAEGLAVGCLGLGIQIVALIISRVLYLSPSTDGRSPDPVFWGIAVWGAWKMVKGLTQWWQHRK